MMDDSMSHDSPADPRHAWGRMREKMREAIRAELDALDLTDDARRALELIVESSLRPSEIDGDFKLIVIDHNGTPRTVDRNGRQDDFTMQDLLAELRGRYPVLFRPAKRERPMPAEDGEKPRERGKPQRDWLTLDQGGAQPNIETGPMSAERERIVFSETKTFSWLRPSLAFAAAAALLLGIGVFIFKSEDRAVPQPGATAPGPVASSPIREPEPSSTGSTTASASLRGVPDVIDTATLSLNGEVVRLFGVEWAPGAGKPEDLAQYLNGREVACEPVGGNDVYRCRVGEQDLSRVVLFNGGGKPADDATPELKAAADKAREARIGVWSNRP